MNHTKFSLHEIDDAESPGFLPEDYSRFKYGSGKISGKFGKALAIGFIENFLLKNPIEEQIVVISSPYSFIPTATFAMKDAFVSTLNRYLAQKELAAVQEAKVDRTITYKEDYGALDAAQRMKLIGNDKFHIDSSFLVGKVLIFLDDIRITGSHERVVLKMAKEFNLQNKIYMLYFAELVNPEIPPQYENYLNYFSVQSVFDLQDIISSDDFRFNTRVVKYILNYEHYIFKTFIKQQTTGFVNELFDLALGNCYHTIDAYKSNLDFIKNELLNPSKLEIYGN